MEIEDFINENTLKLIVRPNRSSNKIIGYDSERKALKLDICKPPENNKANIEIVKFFKKEYGKNIKIVAGLSSRKKIVKFIS